MHIAIFSDVHANFPALEAVLADIAAARVDATYALGDLVGYAPSPTKPFCPIGWVRSAAGVARAREVERPRHRCVSGIARHREAECASEP